MGFFVFVPGSFDVGDVYHAWALSQEKVARERVRPMMLGELNAIVAGGESEQVEFKKSTGQRTDAAKAVCAMLNAAVVLFGKADRFMPHYPQCLLRMARFRGVTKSEFIDNQQARGHAFQLLIRAQRFMQDHLPIAGRIVPGVFERIDEPLYPPEALREALANALCHRDYGIGGGSIGVAIFDDRLEISSTGPLHFGLTPDDLLKPHASKPWNRLISNVFYRRAIIEQWGRGTLKMVELTRQAGLVPPEFEEQTGEVIVRFRPVGYELSALQEEILNVLAELGPSSIAEIVGSVEGAKRTIQRNLNTLRESGLVRLEGSGRSARWTV